MPPLAENTDRGKIFNSRIVSMGRKCHGFYKDLNANVFVYITSPYGDYGYRSDPNFPEEFHIRASTKHSAQVINQLTPYSVQGEWKCPEDFMTSAELREFLQRQEVERASTLATVNPPALPPGFEYLNQYNIAGNPHGSANQYEEDRGRLPSLSFMAPVPLSPFSRTPPFERQPQIPEYNTLPSQSTSETGFSLLSDKPPLEPRHFSMQSASQSMETPPPSRSSQTKASSTPPQLQFSSCVAQPISIPSTPPHVQELPAVDLLTCSLPPTPSPTPSTRKRTSNSSTWKSARRPTRIKTPVHGLQALAAAAAIDAHSPVLPLGTDSEHEHLNNDLDSSASDSSNDNSVSEYSDTSPPPALPRRFRKRMAAATKKRPASPTGAGDVRRLKFPKSSFRKKV